MAKRDVLADEHTNRAGISIFTEAVHSELRFLAREQLTSDVGIDLQVEIATPDQGGTGRLLAVQVKSGSSRFRESSGDAWVFRFGHKKAIGWLSHSLPVLIVLVNTETRTAYWQHLSAASVIRTNKRYKVLVPKANTVESAGEEWTHLASEFLQRANMVFEDVLRFLPPSCRTVLTAMRKQYPDDAAALALRLADGRTTPTVTVDDLLDCRPFWMDRSRGAAWHALGMFAQEREFARGACMASEMWADQTTGDKAVPLAISAIMARSYDMAKAHELLAAAEELNSDNILVPLASSVVNASDAPGVPRALTADFLNHPNLDSDPSAQWILGDNAKRIEDYDGAIRHFRRVCELDPSDAGRNKDLADALFFRSMTPKGRAGDHEEAGRLLLDAHLERRMWDAPSAELLEMLLRVSILNRDFETALAYAAAPPIGRAREAEAELLEARVAAVVAAASMNLTKDAQTLAGFLGTGARERLLAADVNGEKMDDVEKIRLLTESLDEAEERGDASTVAPIVISLARMGVDRIAALDALVDSGHAPGRLRGLAAVALKAHESLAAALPEMRLLAAEDIGAAELLILRLQEEGTVDEAIRACDDAYRAFENPALLATKARIQFDDDRVEDAGDTARAVLALEEVAATDRLQMQRIVARSEGDTGDWLEAVRRLERIVNSQPKPRPTDIWNLVTSHLNIGDSKGARAVLDEFDPPVQSPTDASLWFQVVITQPLGEAQVEHLLELRGVFGDDATTFGQMLTYTIGSIARHDGDPDSDSNVSPELGTRLHAMLNELRSELGDDAVGLEEFRGPLEAQLERIKQDLIEQYERMEPVRELLEAYGDGNMPLPPIVYQLRRGYAAAVLQVLGGYIVSGTPVLDEHIGECEVAARARGGRAVIETSALAVTQMVGEGESYRREFYQLNSTTHQRRDLLQSQIEVAGMTGKTGSMVWDPKSDRVVMTDNDPEDVRRLQRQLLAMQSVQVRPHPDPVLRDFPELADDSPWLGTIQLAKNEHMPLWSDDLAVRRLARSVGVEAFGTTALVDAMGEAEAELAAGNSVGLDLVAARQRDRVLDLVRHGVVDVPFGRDGALQLGREAGWIPIPALLAARRPAFWAWSDERLGDVREICRAARTAGAENASNWRFATMDGLAQYCQSEPATASTALGAAAFVSNEEDALHADFVSSLRLAASIAGERDLPNPLERGEEIVDALSGWGQTGFTAEFVAERIREAQGDLPDTETD